MVHLFVFDALSTGPPGPGGCDLLAFWAALCPRHAQYDRALKLAEIGPEVPPNGAKLPRGVSYEVRPTSNDKRCVSEPPRTMKGPKRAVPWAGASKAEPSRPPSGCAGQHDCGSALPRATWLKLQLRGHVSQPRTPIWVASAPRACSHRCPYCGCCPCPCP